jgi:predicted nucleic acid-binding protein
MPCGRVAIGHRRARPSDVVVVDSSVWIAYFRAAETEPVRKLETLEPELGPLLGDIILLELLQGARDVAHALRIEQRLRRFPVLSMLDADLAVEAAANYRLLRNRGITIRKVADLIIGTFCIEHHHSLLHDDRDFEPMRIHLGLQVH